MNSLTPRARRIAVARDPQPWAANLEPRYAIEEAAWIWHPERGGREQSLLRFSRTLRCAAPARIRLHVSADQRFELSVDGELLALGPDRCDVEAWSFACYELELDPGEHELTALVWWIGSHAPCVQRSHRGGFICKAEGDWAAQLDSGFAPWQVQDLSAAWRFDRRPDEPAMPQVGDNQTVDGAALRDAAAPQAATVVTPPLQHSLWAGVRGGWRLEPSCLPKQQRERWRGGHAAALIDGGLGLDDALAAEHAEHADLAHWQRLIDGDGSLTVPPRRSVSLLWELDDYRCAYPELTLSGGAGAEVDVCWAEAAFERPASRASKHKGQRDHWIGKYIRGPRDSFRPAGGASERYRTCWWRSGRLVLITVRTADEALRIDALGLLETRYPLAHDGHFASDDPSIDGVVPLCVRTMQMCAHETWQDCPHYEQTMYVGDSRLHVLIAYAMQRDDALALRCMQLFEQSRKHCGAVNASAPANMQVLPTFPCYWPLMLHDYAWWRGGRAGVAPFMPGLRANMEWLGTLCADDGLMHDLPGWPFIDTVPEWIDQLYGPDSDAGPPAVVNLLHAYALRVYAELEELADEPLLAQRARDKADAIAQRIDALCWNQERGVLTDYPGDARCSQHAQIFALLGGGFDAARRERMLDALLHDERLAQTQTHHTCYLFEALARHGRGAEILPRLDYWQNLPAQGLVTAPEMFEPSRSDCHAWGGHPIFHLAASIAGIRPAAPGFASVRIAPALGTLRRIDCRMPHPRGAIAVRLRIDDAEALHASVELPDGIDGTLHWRGQNRRLQPGTQELTLAAQEERVAQ